MTIGVGLRDATGVVLCADRQITRRGYDKYYEEKVFLTIEQNGYWLAMTAAGDPSLYKEIWQKVTKEAANPPYAESIRESFERILNEMNRLDAELPLEMLIGIATAEETKLFHFVGKGLHEVSDYAFVGVGDSSLLRFLAEGLYSTGETVLLAIYLVMCAKTYIDACGGPTDLVILINGPNARRVGPEIIADIEKELGENEAKTLHQLLMISLPLPIEPTRLS